jgi:hypothetical protein
MKRTDWIPVPQQELADLALVWKTGLSDTATQTAFGWDAEACAETVALIAAFFDARSAYRDVDSSQNALTKKNAQSAMITAMRDFANTYIRFNKKMEDADKFRYGIRTRDGKLTRRGTPGSQAFAAVSNTKNRFEHRIRAINAEGKASMPSDAVGVRYAWQVGGDRPVSGAHLPNSRFLRRSVCVVSHTEAEKGMIVYYAVCYENGKGESGPWSTVVEAIVG